MTQKNFTTELKNIFDYIQNTLLKEYDNEIITTEYFILSTLENENSVGYKVLSKIMLHETIEKSKTYFHEWLSNHSITSTLPKQYDEIFEKSINDAKINITKNNLTSINSGHILATIILNNKNIFNFFKTNGVTINQINTQVTEETNNLLEETIQKQEKQEKTPTIPEKHIKKNKPHKKETNYIPQIINENMVRIDGECARITTNLNEKAFNQEIENIYGNENIYQEIFNILSKRNKNNVVIVGKSGVGKTDTVKNLANLIVNNKVPRTFKNKILLEVDFNALFYGTQMRGAFEAKMKNIIAELQITNNYIFFIDAIENVMTGHFSQNEIQDFIETLLKEKNAMLICTCSDKEYTKKIADNPSWDRYFEKIVLEEPTEKDCINILQQHINKLETFHDVQYDSTILTNTIKLTKRYITEKNLPDSAIDILDKTGAKKSLINTENQNIINCKNEINIIQSQINEIKQNYNENNSIILDNLIKQQIELNNKLNNLIKFHNLTKPKEIVTINDIKQTIANKTNIPITELTIDDKQKLKNLNDKIKNIVIGQDEAVDTVCQAIKRQRIGLNNPNKPAVFLFTGQTGTGKSYLAKTIAKEIFGDEKKLIRLDMAEYAEKTSITKLIGTGSGYIGYENGGILTETIKKNKHCVLLLDEIEKADEQIHNAFLSMFDEGRMTDNKGNTVDFKNVIVIMTSNAGAKQLDEKGNGIGFNNNQQELKKEIIQKELKHIFKPEFLNRIDKIVFFNKLNDENLKNIISLEINKIRTKLQEINYNLITNDKLNNIINNIYNKVIENKNMGARPIIREIQTQIEDKITELIIDNNIQEYHTFTEQELLT